LEGHSLDIRNEDEPARQPCCNDEDCCFPQISDGPRKGRGWRTVVFTVVIFLALCVMAYSLIWRDPARDGTSCGTASEFSSRDCGAMTNIPALKDRLAGYDFAVLVFPGSMGILPPDIASTIALASAEIEDLNQRAVMIVIPPEDPIWGQVGDDFEIIQFPAVLTLGLRSGTLLTGPEITRDAILQTYYEDVGADVPDDSSGVDQINGMD